MLRLLLISIPTILIACSSDRSRPVAPAGKTTDNDCALCDLFDAFNDAKEEEEDETAEEEAETDSTSSGGEPDLIVQSPSVSDSMLTPEQAFTLHANVHNQGDEQAAATMLHYYRSNNATITASDTEVGTGTVDSLDASATSAQSIELTVPTGEGSRAYFYGACVDSVSGESNTDNNCSSAVRITVSGQETPTDTSQVVVEDDTLPRDPIEETTQDPATRFNIMLLFDDNVPEDERLWFRQAADMWEEVIVGDLPDEVIPESWSYYEDFTSSGDLVDDLVISVNIIDDHPAIGGAQGGPLLYRSDGSGLPLTGRVRYESEEYWENLKKNEHLFSSPKAYHAQNWGEHRIRMMALHEIGHVLGLGVGPNWSEFIRDKGERWGGEPGVTGYDAHFADPKTIEIFNALDGPTFTGNPVPTNWSGVHWRGQILPEDVMGGHGSPHIKRISAVTVEALASIGYQVDRSMAGSIQRWENGPPSPGQEGFDPERDQYPFSFPYSRGKAIAPQAHTWTCLVGEH